MSVRFPLGVRQALAWAVGIAARDGYVSPSIAALMGGGRETGSRMSIMDQHADAAFIVAMVDRLPEPYQAVIWFRASVLPWDVMQELAVRLAPQIARQMPTGVYNRRALQMAILATAGARGCSVRAIRAEHDGDQVPGQRQTWEWRRLVADKLDAFARAAEADIERDMIERGWI